MTYTRPSRRRRWIIVPALLLGAGGWVVVSRRSRAAAPDVWAPRPPVERPLPVADATTAARPSPTPRPRPTAAPVASPPAETRPEPTIRPLVAASPARPHGPGSAEPLPDGSAPGPEYTIKGNAGSMLFHPPSSPYYARTKAEVWFRTPEDAVAAGFTAYVSRRKPAPGV